MTPDSVHTRALYLDVEMTCWSSPPPPGMRQEIIEIGVVEMDLIDPTTSREAAYFVRPRQWEISPKCTKLTGITADDIQTGRPFPEVLTAITEQFEPCAKLCCTWGDDAALVAQTCSGLGIKSPLRNLLDLGYLVQFSLLLKQRPSLSGAVKILGMAFEGVPHGALADARNTARIHAAVIRRMRQEPDPPTLQASERAKTIGRGEFAEKLSRCLNRLPNRGTESEDQG